MKISVIRTYGTIRCDVCGTKFEKLNPRALRCKPDCRRIAKNLRAVYLNKYPEKVNKYAYKNSKRAKCDVCKRMFTKSTYNARRCSVKCKKKARAKFCAKRYLDNIDFIKTTHAKWRHKNYKAIQAKAQEDYLKNRETSALVRLYKTSLVTDAKRLKCAMKRVDRRRALFSDYKVSRIKGGEYQLAYKRVRAMSKRQIKSSGGGMPD